MRGNKISDSKITFHREGSKETTQKMKTLSIETLFKGIGYGFVKQPNLEQV